VIFCIKKHIPKIKCMSLWSLPASETANIHRNKGMYCT